MPDWILDQKIQGLLTLIIALMFGLSAAIWTVFKWIASNKSEPAVTKLEIKYPNEAIEERITKLEGVCMQILHELRRSDEGMDEVHLIAQFLLDRCKAPEAKVHKEGMEIILSPEEIEEATFIKISVVKDTLEEMDKEELIRISGNNILIYGTK